MPLRGFSCKGGVGQPIDSLLGGGPNFRIYNRPAQVLPLRAWSCRVRSSRRHIPNHCFQRPLSHYRVAQFTLWQYALPAGTTSGRTPSRRLTLGTRFRFLLDLLALLDRFVAIVISSFDLDCFVQLAWPLLLCPIPGPKGPKTI